MKPWEVIKHLESDNSRLFKESVIEQHMMNDHEEFFDGIKLCLDSLITFGIKKVSEKNDNSIFDKEFAYLHWDEFAKFCLSFYNREITGNAAIDSINYLMNKASTDQWNYWYRRILIKDLRCGVSEKTINNVAKKVKKSQYSVPVFTCQLAQDQADHQSKMTGKKIIDTKMDGSRVLSVLYKDGRVEQFSRNGKAIENFPVIVDQLKELVPFLIEDTVLDGEVMSSSFQDLMKQMHRKENVQTDDAVLYLFDAMPLQSFLLGSYHRQQILRKQDLSELMSRVCLDNVNSIDYEIVDLDSIEGQQRFSEINKDAVDGGYEGIMIKDPDAPYECKRSSNWLKMKPFITVDLEVVSLEEGTGKYEGMLGAMICSGIDQDKKITVSVGSGLTDQQRKEFWTKNDEVLGKIVEIKADAITHSQDSMDDYSLRFPVFMGFRNDKE